MTAAKCPCCGYIESCPKCNGGICACCGSDLQEKEQLTTPKK